MVTLVYAIKQSFNGLPIVPSNVLGILSVVFWVLVILISIKYLTFVLTSDKARGRISFIMEMPIPKLILIQSDLYHRNYQYYPCRGQIKYSFFMARKVVCVFDASSWDIEFFDLPHHRTIAIGGYAEI